MARKGRGIVAAGAFGLALWAAPARAADCASAVISDGDTQAQVRERCGEPAQEETWRADLLGRATGPPPAPVPAIAVFREAEWIYNPGPRHLLFAVRFRDGRVVRTETLGPGFPEDRRDADRCHTGLFDPGEPRVMIENACGPPAREEARTNRRTRHAFGRRERVHVHVQEWTYDFGPRFFTRLYVFENGRLVRTESGERGE